MTAMVTAAPRQRAHRRGRAAGVVGVADHGGWAILMTVTATGALLDRRRVELVDAGVPRLPHHHDGQKLPLAEAVALVGQVRAAAEAGAAARLAELVADLGREPDGIALRVCPALPATVAERITSYRAMCVADWVMYREALATAASARGWSVHWYDPADVLARAAHALGRADLDELFAQTRAAVGPPWQKDHRMAMAAAIAAAGAP